MARAASRRCVGLLLAAALLGWLPSCITSTLWADNRTRRPLAEARVRLPVIDPTRPGLVLVCDASGTGMVPALLGPGTTSPWVQVEPIEHAESLRTVLAGMDERRQGGVLEHLAAQETGRVRTSLRIWLGTADNLPAGWLDLPGVRQRWGLKAWIAELDLPCRVASAESPDAEWPSAGFRRFHVRRSELVDDDHATFTKILLTPVTVVLDVLIAPIELLTIGRWW